LDSRYSDAYYIDLRAAEFRDQRKDAWAIEVHVDKFIDERNVLMLETKHKAAVTENIRKETEALRLEGEKLQAQRKLEYQLRFLTQKCKDIAEERDALLLESRTIATDRDILRKDRASLIVKIKNLHAQLKDAALLEEQLQVERKQCEDIAKERDSFKLRSQIAELDKHFIGTVMETLKCEAEELRTKIKDYAQLEEQLKTVREQCEKIKRERNAFMLRAQQIAESRENIKIERDALAIETEDLRTKIKNVELLEMELNDARLHCDNIKKERDFYKLKSRETAGNIEATREDIDALKLENEESRSQCKNGALLEKQVKTVSQ
jgi:hypothetical protein